MMVDLDAEQIERLIELVGNHRDDVYSNEVSGYAQSKDDELIDLDMLMSDLRTAR